MESGLGTLWLSEIRPPDLATLDYASKHQMSLEQVKAKLADTAMRLRVQKELSAAQHSVDLHTHSVETKADLFKHQHPPALEPPTEPAGRANTGESFAS